ncbi:hypothetical protein HD806DRAFT_549107 [Xylariaceae sp. AK1471]|nr:hypothetical protein HD806DRAFT_549107 [Xylariaceae sp. AK1471]
MTPILESYSFATSQTDFRCPKIPFVCLPPESACAEDLSTLRRYCCDHAGACWNDIATCASDGSTFECRNDEATWCCVSQSERCDQSRANSCLSTGENPIRYLEISILQDAYSSLSTDAASTATLLAFDPSRLAAAAQASSLTSSSAILETVPPRDPIPSPSNSLSGTQTYSLSSGGIGGIVGGGFVGILAVAFAVRFFTKQNNQRQPVPAEEPVITAHDGTPKQPPPQTIGISEVSAQSKTPELPFGHAAWELSAQAEPRELPAITLDPKVSDKIRFKTFIIR